MSVNQIIKKQKEFFATHKTKDIGFRINQLKKLKSAILDYNDKLLDAIHKDLNKSKMETYLSEIGFCLDELNYAIKNLRSWAKVQKVKGSTFGPFTTGRIFYEPYGVVLIISPYNYPLHTIISPLIGAIAAGDCTIIKPSELTPNTAKVVQKMIDKYFQEDYIRVVQGGPKVSQQLLNQNLDYIFFSGGASTGKIVMSAAAKNLTPLTLALATKNPCIVDEDVNVEIAARRITWGKFSNAGQACVAPDYLLVHKKIKQKLVNKIKEKIVEFYGNNIKKSEDYGRSINKKHFKRLKNYLKEGDVIFGGETDQKELYISPTLIENVLVNGKIMQEEIFGPILPIIEYSEIDEVIKFVNSRPKSLALYIFSNNKKVQQKIIGETSSGGVCVNDTMLQFASKELPFGGVGDSGFGRYHGKASFELFSNKKSILEQTTLIDPKLRYPPYADWILRVVKKIFR